MFDWLLGPLSNLFRGFWGVLKDYLGTTWTILLGVFGVVIAFFGWLTTSIEQIGTHLANVVLPELGLALPGGLTQSISLANTIAPMSEACAYLILWGALAAVLQIYRFLKSWLPTLSG